MKAQVVERSETRRPRKANECFTSPRQFCLPGRLFDEFWQEGELALLFGPSGVGKSILAVQIGEALARGRNMDGFRMPSGRRKVLYVDLVLRDEQFQARYSHCPPHLWPLEPYKFAERLYRDRPQPADDLCDWLRETVRENGFEVVMIDDLSAVSRTCDGTRETLALMRGLRQIRDELNISILVLADSAEPGRRRLVSEADLKRSRVLCGVADSVFAIGRHPRSPDNRYLVQTRSASAPVFWDESNAPVCRLLENESGFLGCEFDKRFARRHEDEKLRLVGDVKRLRDNGLTYRAIEALLGISKSQAARLYKRWTPAMDGKKMRNEEEMRNAECGTGKEVGSDTPSHDTDSPTDVCNGNPQSAFRTPHSDEPEECDEAGPEKPVWTEDADVIDETPKPAAREADDSPPERRSVYDLKRGVDGYGREIFIESENSLGEPAVWYKFNEHGDVMRHVRVLFGTNIYNLGASPYV